MTANELIGELLTLLERREAQLMEWGFFDVYHSGSEIVSLFSQDPKLGEQFRELVEEGNEELFIDDLASSSLLVRADGNNSVAYRSRFAESLRLFVKLRQRFRPDDWQHAPELVSEARLHLAPRRFPERNVQAGEAWNVLSEVSWLPSVQRATLDALSQTSTGSLRFAPFQVRSAQRVLRNYRGAETSSGTVVTAGTGGGKTKAFYIPALMGIAADISADPRKGTKVLAIYPRNVLLSDQFGEAVAQTMLVNQGVRQLRRPIRVGVLVGDVPFSPDFEGDKRNSFPLKAWHKSRSASGLVLPHLRHPETGENLLWLDSDRRAGRTGLRRESDPNEIVVPDGVVALTREELLASPPDIFLTSIEMLNKELPAEIGRAVLGFGNGSSSLRLILLDEIHTYEGITGAQVPWVLRRLSYWTRVRRNLGVHYVGLSATLQDAPNHLATLTGVPESLIEEVCPDPEKGELSLEGNEYNVVLKSHPGSGAGVLSTSIQSVMLGARLLTPRTPTQVRRARFEPSHFFGRKLFGFTDNLDVVNRWLPNFIEAERVKKLAKLRAGHSSDELEWQAGQVWRLPEELGHDLSSPLKVGRTSSQDPGIDTQADVVLATSALEVGFDDPEVGMVLQHKAPRSAASFLQRKGRAGRRRGHRPWTIVVLSDHGRDRWAFRDSERLFAPVLERLALPAFNTYVLRIQATWFLVDWIADKVGRGVPSLYLSRAAHEDQRARESVRKLIEDQSQREAFARDLTNWLRHAQGGFRLADVESTVRDLLWNPPRAVLRHVVPELWKQMVHGFPESGGARRARILPKYIPSTTWEVLDAQDVELALPSGEPQFMEAARALWEAVPGRVSRRHAVSVREASKWLAWSGQLLLDPAPESVAVDELMEAFVRVDGLIGTVLFQPTRIRLDNVPTNVKNSSNAEWNWSVEIVREGQPSTSDLHSGPVASKLFSGSCAFLHRDQANIRVYRHARVARYELHLERGIVRRGRLTIAKPSTLEEPSDVAIGYVRAVDGMVLDISRELLSQQPYPSREMLRSFRYSYFRYRALRSDLLHGACSTFGINLLCVTAVGMVVATALRKEISLEDAWRLIPNKKAAAEKVLLAIFPADIAADETGDDNTSYRVKEVLDLWSRPDVEEEVERLLTALWSDGDADFRVWLEDIFLETVRAALESAVHSLLPEVSDEDLNVDIVREGDRCSIVISEADPGGVGVIERLLTEVAANPGLFDNAVEYAISDCRNERLLDNVRHAVRLARRQGSAMSAAFESVRQAADYEQLLRAKSDLVSELDLSGCFSDRESVTALVGKALPPGSNFQTDRWLDGLARAHSRSSERIDLAIDSRLWAYAVLGRDRPRERMAETLRRISGRPPSAAQLFHSVLRLTIDPCRDSCPQCLGTTHDVTGISPSRRYARRWLRLDTLDHIVDLNTEPRWLEKLDAALTTNTRIRIRYDPVHCRALAEALCDRLSREYDRGYALASFRVAGVRRSAGAWETLLHIDESEGA